MNILEERNQTYEFKFGEILKKIKEYDRIAIFRHDHPDYDALGSQMAFVHFLKDNFPNKTIIYTGDDHVTLTGQCFPKMEEIEDAWFDQPFLGIVVDLSNLDRICDERAKKAEYLIKIDHHPEVEPYGDLAIVDESMFTGDNFPKIKESVRKMENLRDLILDTKNKHKNSIIFAGTKVVTIQRNEESEPLPKNIKKSSI